MASPATVTKLYTTNFEILATVFSHIHPPYKREDVIAFNNVYRRIYKQLANHEKAHAERMVDFLIEGLEDRGHAALIYGNV
jgi:hypothetical protein